MPAIRTFGSWLAQYKGRNQDVHLLKDAFRDCARRRKERPSHWTNGAGVYVLLEQDDCLPEKFKDLLVQCEQVWRSDRRDLGAREYLALLRKDHPAA